MAALRLVQVVTLCALWACAGHAQESQPGQPESQPGQPESKPEKPKFEGKFNAETFVSLYDVLEDSAFNPGNLLAMQPERQLDGLLRAELSVDYSRVRAWMSPRVGLHSDTVNGATHSSDVGYIQDWGVRYVGDNLSASVGRELLYWGPGLFTSPSNPFYATVNPINPFIEPTTRNIARVQYSPNDAWRVSLIANYSLGRDAPDYPEFRNTYAVKVDYSARNYTVGTVASVRDGHPQLGLVGQITATDALLLYSDLGIAWSSPALYPQRDASPVGWSFVPRSEDGAYLDAVTGMSYTFTGGATVSLEYRYYGAGYSRAQTDDYYRLAHDSANALIAGSPASGQAAGLLAQAANPYLRGLNRNYVGAQLLLRDLLPDLSITFLSSTNLDDGGSQLTAVANYYLTDRSRIAADVVVNLGGSNTEYGRYVGNAIFVGYKYFF